MGDGHKTCAKVGCDRPATLMPVLEVRSSEDAAPYTMTLGMVICVSCATMDAQDYISDEGWAQLATVVKIMCGKEPVRSLTTVSYAPPGDEMRDELMKIRNGKHG